MAKVKPCLAGRQACTVYLVRHGETDWNVQLIMQGKTSGVPLTKAGIKQAREISERFKKIRFAAVFSSDLLRARQTAQVIAYRKKLAVVTAKAIRERSFGRYEGVAMSQYERELKNILDQFQSLPDKEKFKFEFPHGIESVGKVVERVLTWLRELAVAYSGKTVLVVCHGGVMRLLLIHLGYAGYKQLPPYSIDNTAFIVLESDGVDFEIKKVFGVHLK